MKTHQIKIDPEYFERLIRGDKPFEFRKNDRDYRPGDIVTLLECKVKDDGFCNSEYYSGRSCTVVIKDVYDLGALYPKLNGFVVFTFHMLKFSV
ncbi:MAG: DUF3850 domain-containing protein [Clostridia bacterium]|nr:DUF3850 domain-containing protein [Clostridia bacterium]MBR4035075.1 DUF3850 domain-containing protein [Clostridia bacterium]